MTASIEVSKETERRFVLGKQGLWPGRRSTGAKGTRAAVVACEHLQLDPLVIVARSHDLMLHSRVAGYQPEMFDALAYEKRVFFDWGSWLAVRPMTELPYWRTLMRRDRAQPRMQEIADHHAEAIAAVRLLLHERGTLANRELETSDRPSLYAYRGAKEASLALYYLWRVGEAMTHHRNGFERVCAPAEAIAPASLLTEASDHETDRFMARKAIAFAGIGRVGPLSAGLIRKVAKADELAITHDLVDAGEITAVAVENSRVAHYVLTEDLARLDAVARGRVPKDWKPLETTTEEEVTLLSPLDPVHTRSRAKALFDFEYVWEIYKRPELVQFGRYTMPILWGDRLVGRIDPRLDRKTATLVVNGVWTETPADARDPAFGEALRLGVQRLLTFLGAEHVDAAAVKSPALRKALGSLNPRRGAKGSGAKGRAT